MRTLKGRIEAAEAKIAPNTLQPARRIIGHSQAEIDRQVAELRAEGFAGLIICRQIVTPGEARHAN